MDMMSPIVVLGEATDTFTNSNDQNEILNDVDASASLERE